MTQPLIESFSLGHLGSAHLDICSNDRRLHLVVKGRREGGVLQCSAPPARGLGPFSPAFHSSFFSVLLEARRRLWLRSLPGVSACSRRMPHAGLHYRESAWVGRMQEARRADRPAGRAAPIRPRRRPPPPLFLLLFFRSVVITERESTAVVSGLRIPHKQRRRGPWNGSFFSPPPNVPRLGEPRVGAAAL